MLLQVLSHLFFIIAQGKGRARRKRYHETQTSTTTLCLLPGTRVSTREKHGIKRNTKG